MKINKKPTHIEFSTLFNRQLKDSPREIKLAFRDSLILFKENQNHPALRNHPLKREFTGYRSIDVNDDWRALYREEGTKKQITIMFHRIGTHKHLYR